MWKCRNCNSTEVEMLDWVDINSGDNLEDNLEEYYCRGCQSQVDIYYEEDDNNDDDEPFVINDEGGD